MSERYPKIRLYSLYYGEKYLTIRESVSICFYMRRPHRDVVDAVMRSLEVYRRAVGLQTLGWYADEEHGPARVRELALELAEGLPFNSGHAGLSFHVQMEVLGLAKHIREDCFRYPGLDIPELHTVSGEIGTCVKGASWLTFLGQPVLGELGGVAGLRERLRSPEISVKELGGERAVVTLGEWPEAGDTEQGKTLPAYRELARVLAPWLWEKRIPWDAFTVEDMRRWEHRFND